MARRATLKARVQETPFIDRVVDEAYTSIVQGTHGAGACKRKGARLVDSLFHIGAAPAGFDVAAYGIYDDIEGMFGESDDNTFETRIRAYAEVCMVSCHLSQSAAGSTSETQWEVILDGSVTVDKLEQCSDLDKLRATITTKYKSSLQNSVGAGLTGGAGGAVGGGGGVAVPITAHRPELPQLPSEEKLTNAQRYRHFKVMMASDPKDQSHTAMRKAIEKDPDVTDAWRLYLQVGQGKTGWDPTNESAHVREFLVDQMRDMQPETFAKDDLEEAKGFTQTMEMSLTDYLRKKHALMLSARLSGEAHGGAHPDVATERAWCDMAKAGLLRLMKVKLEEHIASVELVAPGGLPGYDGYGNITDWKVFTKAAIKVGLASKLDPGGKKRKTDGEKGKAESDMTAAQKNALRNARKAAVAVAKEEGITTVDGYGLMAREILWGEDNKPTCHSCYSAEAAGKRRLPPMMVDEKGKKAPNDQQPCQFAWRCETCPRGTRCYFRHISKEDFLKELADGKSQVVSRDGTYAAINGGAMAANALDANKVEALLTVHADRLEKQIQALTTRVESSVPSEQRLDLMDKQLATLTEVTVKLLERTDPTKKSSVEKSQEQQRREQQRQRLASMAAAAFDEDTKPSGEAGGTVPSAMMVGTEGFWELPEILEEAALMVGKATSMYESSHGQGDAKKRGSKQPIVMMGIGSLLLQAMMDSGCAPTGLMTVGRHNEIEKKIGGNCMGPLVMFKEPKILSGVGKDAVSVVGCRTLQCHHPESKRPLSISVGLMQGGNTGCADLLVGNYHMTEDWNFNMNRKEFRVDTPEDGGEPMRFELGWVGDKARKVSFAFAASPRK